jgi:hypothetical protein
VVGSLGVRRGAVMIGLLDFLFGVAAIVVTWFILVLISRGPGSGRRGGVR